MISDVLGLSVLVDYIVIFHVCNIWKNPFYCCYNAGFFFGELTRIFLLDFYWQILLGSFTEPCLQAVHRVGSDGGQREVGQPLELKLWTDQSLLREMLFSMILRWLLWTISTTLSRPIIGGIYTPVPVLCTLGWSGSRWFRMMTADWYFSPL
jgi:hypothetical protein